MTAPQSNASGAQTDNGSQQPTDQQAADQGKVLAYAVAAECDDPKAVDAEMSKALDAAGPDGFGMVTAHAVTVLATEILASLLNKADRGGMPRLRTDLLGAAAAAAPDSSSTDNGPAAA